MYVLDNLINGNVGTASGFCAESMDIWKLVGTLLLIFKIVIPILLIILGAIDLGKAVISSDEKQIGKSVKSFAWRVVAAVAVFFLPSLVSAIFSVIDAFQGNGGMNDYTVCKECVVYPNSKCKK